MQHPMSQEETSCKVKWIKLVNPWQSCVQLGTNKFVMPNVYRVFSPFWSTCVYIFWLFLIYCVPTKLNMKENSHLTHTNCMVVFGCWKATQILMFVQAVHVCLFRVMTFCQWQRHVHARWTTWMRRSKSQNWRTAFWSSSRAMERCECPCNTKQQLGKMPGHMILQGFLAPFVLDSSSRARTWWNHAHTTMQNCFRTVLQRSLPFLYGC